MVLPSPYLREGFDDAPADPGAALLGAASPLWLMFAGAAGMGMAYWWMSRWAQPVNLEAWFGGHAEPADEPAPKLEFASIPVEEAPPVVAKPLEVPVTAVLASPEPAALSSPEPAAETAPPVKKPVAVGKPKTPPPAAS